ncbi:3-oxoacyl-reductase [Lineolata rhizophorae]|uniref:3-oxoacyl-reductase n=1 Tax=Lineolata rhizophorae TaxID=578093 RepID=A0A6A6P5M5_9PEZI|nr:3-oxoacyl-reductase [Lineolata rhizophorae]
MARPHDGKVGIITGGSRGIGASIAENLAAKGCNLLLVFTSESSKAPTDKLSSKLAKEHGIRVASVQANLSDPAQNVPKILSAAKENFSDLHSGIFQVDILVNNAGVAAMHFLNDPDKGAIGETHFDFQYRINVLAPLLLTQACEPFLPRDRSGRIVNVSSVSSSIGYEGQSVYSGTKAALDAMTRVWSRELAERATVNAINPGPVHGDMYTQAGQAFWNINQKYVDQAPLMAYKGDDVSRAKSGMDPAEYDKMVLENMGGQRPAFGDEIAGVVGMLCSAESAWTTGSVICANGGMKMSIA